jgi:hypothetical protein
MKPNVELLFTESGDSPPRRRSRRIDAFLGNAPMTLTELRNEPRCDGSCNGRLDCPVAEASREVTHGLSNALSHTCVLFVTKEEHAALPCDYEPYRGVPASMERSVVRHHAYATRSKLFAQVDTEYADKQDVTHSLFRIMESYLTTSHKIENMRKRDPLAFDKLHDELYDIVLDAAAVARERTVTKKLSHLVQKSISNAVTKVWEAAEYAKARKHDYEIHAKHQAALAYGFSTIREFDRYCEATEAEDEAAGNVCQPAAVLNAPPDDEGYNDEDVVVARAVEEAAQEEEAVVKPMTRRDKANLRKRGKKAAKKTAKRPKASKVGKVQPAKRRALHEALAGFKAHHSEDKTLMSVAEHIGSGKSVRDIANTVGLSVHTVERLITKVRKSVKENVRV